MFAWFGVWMMSERRIRNLECKTPKQIFVSDQVLKNLAIVDGIMHVVSQTEQCMMKQGERSSPFLSR